MEETVVDLRNQSEEERKEGARMNALLYKLNSLDCYSEEYAAVLKEMFGDNIGEGTFVRSGMHGAAFNHLKIGSHCAIGYNVLFMARGGITIEDNVMIAADASVISNNHDLYDRVLLTCKPVVIKKGAWIGGHAIILPGVTVGRYAVVGAGSVVTKDIPDYAVAVGNPARVIRMLDPEKFPKD